MASVVLTSLILLAGALPGADLYLTGHNAERNGKLRDAVAAYADCAAADSSLAPYARVSAARCRGAAGDRAGAISALRRLLAESPEGPWVLMAKLHLAGLLALDNQYAPAGALYAESLEFSPKTWIIEQYDWAAAEAYIRAPESQSRGYAYFRNKVATTVLRQRRIDASRYLEKSPEFTDRLVALQGLIKSAESTDSLKLALRLLPPASAGGKPIDVRTLEPLLTSNKRELTTEQRQAFTETVQAHKNDPWMRLFLAYLARSHTSIGKPEVARFACDLLLSHFHDAEETGEALYWLANRHVRDENNKSAIEQYLRLVKQCPRHTRADAALLAAAELQKKSGDPKGFSKSLEQLTADYPESRHAANAWHWLGRAREAAGHKKDAAKAYRNAVQVGPGNYYAHCAAHRLAKQGELSGKVRDLRIDGAGSYMAPLAIAAETHQDLPAEITASPQFQRMAFFGKHGLVEGEWEALYLGGRLRNGPEDALVYQMMGETGLAKAAMDFAQAGNWGLDGGKPTPARLRIDYPRAYWPQVTAHCRGTGIDPYLVLAIARQESTFRPALTSSAGACGIMQVMPPTAQWLAKVDPSVDAACIANLENPDNSFRLGICYLLRMIERSNGNLVYALASYNAGPGNCSKWQKRWPNADLETFVENIPFSETRGYVKAVLGNYAAYHSLYPPAENSK